MRIYFIFIFLLLGSFSAVGQTEFKYDYKQRSKFVKKAQKEFKRGNIAKTEALLQKIRMSSPGSCGTWDDSDVFLLEVELLNKQGKIDESLQYLDSSFVLVPYALRDSLKIVTLFLKFGKEKVKNAFMKVNKYNHSESSYNSSYWVFLEDLNYKFMFEAPSNYDKNSKRIEPVQTGNEFYNMVKDLPFYKLLQ